MNAVLRKKISANAFICAVFCLNVNDMLISHIFVAIVLFIG